MLFLNLTLPTPGENLALDEALLEECDGGRLAEGVLRVWEPQDYFVVLGRSIVAETEVNLQDCKKEKIPVLRRASGGGSVVVGPGCLAYSLIFSRKSFPELAGVDTTHQFVLHRLAEELQDRFPTLARQGISDLAIADHAGRRLKISGNALRLRRHAVLYHGTFLYNFELPRIARYLDTPQRTPEYRSGRSHAEFVTNLDIRQEELIAALQRAWNADVPLCDWPEELTLQITQEKYVLDSEWLVA
jgi:lipoate---protein ligase